MSYVLSFLGHGLECAFWCGVWHYVLHTKDHAHQSLEQAKHELIKYNSKAILEYVKENHDKAKGAYGHSGFFEECQYPVCKIEREHQ